MKKKFSNLLMILIIGIFVLCAGAQSISQQTEDTSDNMAEGNHDNLTAEKTYKCNIITIHNKGYDQFVKGPVSFSHLKHARQYEVNCWECHHDYSEGENTWSPWKITERCITCHDPIIKKDNVVKLQAAFHKNCKTCHLERDIFKGETGAYKKCGKCHLQEIIIKNNQYKKDMMGPVIFHHQKHEKKYFSIDNKRIPCAECHHEYVEGKNIWKEWDTVKKCGTKDCHDPLEKKGENQERLQTAYHNKCKVCHRDLTKAGKSKNAPYVKCTACHHSAG